MKKLLLLGLVVIGLRAWGCDDPPGAGLFYRSSAGDATVIIATNTTDRHYN